jgi:hypothetical protein
MKPGDIVIATEGELEGQEVKILREFSEHDYYHYQYTLYTDAAHLPYFWCNTATDPTPRTFSIKCLKEAS